MKKLYLLLPLLCLHLCGYGQFYYTITFDNTNYINQFYFDTLQNPNCKWQIGKPSKTVFNAAYSTPNALLTDTLNPLPANDTSVFYFYSAPDFPGNKMHLSIGFRYMMHGDSTSYGMLEISPDMGQNWVDIVKDTIYDINVTCPNNFVGSANGWQEFSADMWQWATDEFGYYPLNIHDADTLLYRFTYISGNAQGIYDGWTIDNLFYGDFAWSIAENNMNTSLHIYPNPHQNSFTLHIKEPVSSDDISITVRNTLGTVCYQQTITGKEHYVSTETWAKGVYLVEAFSENILLGRQKLIKH